MKYSVFLLLLAASACTPAPLPPPVSQADAVAESKAASDAEKYAPQAYAAAEKLRAEAQWLHKEGRAEESGVAGEQALAGYNEAFALARLAKAEERLEKARAEQEAAEKEIARIDRVQSQVEADADAFEMRARVHLDSEEVKDVEAISPERAKARRLAAKQLSAEAGMLCLSTQLLNPKTKGLAETQPKVKRLDTELSHGSVKDDLYPRAAELRAECLKLLTHARRPVIKAAPESASSDRLLSALTKTGKLFAYRDDRGVVVNLASPLSKDGTLTESAAEQLKILAGTAKAHQDFPLVLITHTAKSGSEKRAAQLADAFKSALNDAGVSQFTHRDVQNAQPVVSNRLRGGAEKNERVEVVFVSPGR